MEQRTCYAINQNILNKAILVQTPPAKQAKTGQTVTYMANILRYLQTIAKFLQAQIILSPYSIHVIKTLGRIPMNQTHASLL